MNKEKFRLSNLIFMALCCDMGVFLKKLIAPATNIVTEVLHIPGGIGTSFSIMFVLIGAVVVDAPGCATLMSIVQSLIALAIGSTGSMGLLAPIGYIVPGIIIDVFLIILKRIKISRLEQMSIVNALAGVSAALTANLITFNLRGVPLALYFFVACLSGLISGILAATVVTRIEPIFANQRYKEQYDNSS